mgnify:CR=1 FL=1
MTRIKIEFSQFEIEKSWFLIEKEINSVGELADAISVFFNLPRELSLSFEDSILPSNLFDLFRTMKQ